MMQVDVHNGDAAEMAIIELVGNPRELEAVEAEKKRKAAASKKKASKGSKKAAQSESKREPAEETESTDQSE